MPSLKRHHPAESATMPATEGARGLPTTGTAPGAFRGRGMDDRFGQTERTDNWWLVPVAQAIGLTILIGYANYAAFLGAAHYHYVENGAPLPVAVLLAVREALVGAVRGSRRRCSS